MRVRDFMTRRVVTVRPDTPILAAAKLMVENKISGLPVVEDGRLVGIVSEHDLLRRREVGRAAEAPSWLGLMTEPEELAAQRGRFHDRTVSEVMTPNPLTVTPASSLAEACRIIEDRGIKRLPVVEDGQLVGIIARADLVRALARSIEKAEAAKRPDVSIDARLRELERQMWRNHARRTKPF